MRKYVIAIVSVIAVIAISAGFYLHSRLSSPEYALAQTIKDVSTSGVEGLMPHLTSQTREKIEAVSDFSDQIGLSDMLSSFTEKYALSFLKSKMAEVDWSVLDVMTGKTNADVLIGFDYNGKIVGSIKINLIREQREWKIDGIDTPQFERISLW